MACSVSRQDESNPALWLATQTGSQDEALLPAWDYPMHPVKKISLQPYNKSLIDQAYLVKKTWNWPVLFFLFCFFFFCMFIGPLHLGP